MGDEAFPSLGEATELWPFWLRLKSRSTPSLPHVLTALIPAGLPRADGIDACEAGQPAVFPFPERDELRLCPLLAPAGSRVALMPVPCQSLTAFLSQGTRRLLPSNFMCVPPEWPRKRVREQLIKVV